MTSTKVTYELPRRASLTGTPGFALKTGISTQFSSCPHSHEASQITIHTDYTYYGSEFAFLPHDTFFTLQLKKCHISFRKLELMGPVLEQQLLKRAMIYSKAFKSALTCTQRCSLTSLPWCPRGRLLPLGRPGPADPARRQRETPNITRQRMRGAGNTVSAINNRSSKDIQGSFVVFFCLANHSYKHSRSAHTGMVTDKDL